MKISLLRTIAGLVPADPEAEESYKKLKMGGIVMADIRQIRNPKFLRKYFALLSIGFDNWRPKPINIKYGVPQKSFDRFREDVTILAGYYHVVVRLNNEVRIEADSISFAKMTEETFEKLYNQTINVLLTHVYASNVTRQELDTMVNSYLSFT